MMGFLWRYTNISSLKHMIREKTLRFSNLNSMDDKDESWSDTDTQEGDHVFISCWTDKEEEDLKMWENYCRPDMGSGVRIKLPKNPFSTTENKFPNQMDILAEVATRQANYIKKEYGVDPTNIEEHKRYLLRAQREKPDEYAELVENINILKNEFPICKTPDVEKLLIQVNYTDDINILYPRIHYSESGVNILDFGQYGKCKDTSWAWQREWRYLLHFRHINNGIIHTDGTIDIYPLPFDHYNLILKDEAIQMMEITLSPTITEENRNAVRTLVKESQYDNIKIFESQIKV